MPNIIMRWSSSTHLRDVTINASARLLSPTAISQKYLDSNGSKFFRFDEIKKFFH